MGQGVNADLTRGTNKFDGTLIRNSPRLSMAMDLIRKYPILITHKTCGVIRIFLFLLK